MLALQDGQWQGKQIAPADWIKADDERPEHAASSAITGGSRTSLKAAMEGGDQPEFDTMGFKGQNIVVLPKYNAVVTMTSICRRPEDCATRHCLQILRYMMSEYILPALDDKPSTPDRSAEERAPRRIAARRGQQGRAGLRR